MKCLYVTLPADFAEIDFYIEKYSISNVILIGGYRGTLLAPKYR